MKKILGFSLVELMISLIVISIVTAAFTPILTKKLKTGDVTTSTPTVSTDSITSSSICGTISKGCAECVNDICLGSDNGYYLEDGKTLPCNSVCATCSQKNKCETCANGYVTNQSTDIGCSPCLTGCTSCAEGYYLDNETCKNCSNHCLSCTNASTCQSCETNYFLSTNNYCWNYKCDSYLCYLTKHDGSVFSLYRYPLGVGALSNFTTLAINRCSISYSCSYGASTPMCWFTFGSNKTASDCSYYSNHGYSTCDRPACTAWAMSQARSKIGGGWRLPKLTDPIFYVNWYNTTIMDPFAFYGGVTDGYPRLTHGKGCSSYASDCFTAFYFADPMVAGTNVTLIFANPGTGRLGTFLTGFGYPYWQTQVIFVK